MQKEEKAAEKVRLIPYYSIAGFSETYHQGKQTQTQPKEKKKEDSQLLKSARDSVKLAAEAQHGLISQVLKDYLFSSRPGQKSADEMDVGPDEKAKKAEGVSALESSISSAAGVEVSINGTVPARRADTEPVPMSTSTAEPVGGTDSPMAIA